MFAVSILSLGLLASLTSCGGTSSSNNSVASSNAQSSTVVSSTVATTPTTFAEQLKNAGITSVTYEDPNAALKETSGQDVNPVDATTGGSNTPLYTNASLKSLEELYYRSSLKYMTYFWNKEDTATADKTATTLAQAAALTNAKYVTDLFPNDGKNYSIKSAGNAIGTKSFITSSADGTPNVAVFGAAINKDTSGETPVYYVNATYMTSGITTTNLLNTGRGELLYYEYNPTSNDKMGVGTRNYGCRVDFTVDFTATTYTPKGGVAVNVTAKLDGAAPSYTTYISLKTKLILTNLKTLV